MSDPCPTCGKPVPTNAPSGICPACLIQAGMNFHEDPTVTPASNSSFVPPSVFDLVPHFSQLEISELIGCGGMGAVYKARQTKLDRTVALKVLRPETDDDTGFAQRFNREAQTLARLSHPNIVGIHDFGEISIPDEHGPPKTLYYFVMEYVDGSDVRRLMNNRLSPSETMNVISQVCDALQFAHEEGIVHRDIKPENILIDSRGRVKIADFGLAKLASKTEQQFTLTGTHQVMGTPRYMAPEQMERSRTVDHRADVYSLGVVFYEMLTGEVPMGQFEPPSKKIPNVGVKLDSVVLQAMAREPERRFQSANDMRNEMLVATEGVFPVYDNGAMPGPSTILDMGVKKAFAGIKRELVGPAQTSWIPGGLAIFLSVAALIGIALLLFCIPSKTRLTGRDGLLLLAGVVLLSQVTVLFIFGSNQRRIWRGVLILITGATSLVLVVGYTARGSIGVSLPPLAHEHAELVAESTAAIPLTESQGNQFQIAALAGYVTMASFALTILGAWDLRKSLADYRNSPQAKKRKKRKSPEIAHVGFVVPAGKSVTPFIAPHFQMLGYHLVESIGDEWTFERGAKSGHMGVDLRKCFSVLTIRTGSRPDGTEWVSCGWAIPGAFVSGRQVAKLESEARGLARACGVDSITNTHSSAADETSSQTIISFLGSSSRNGNWKSASTLHVASVLGGCELDFRDAELQPGVNTVNVLGFLGSVSLIVPADLPVDVSGIGVMGNFDQNAAQALGNLDSGSSSLRITGLSLLASVEVTTKRR